MATTLSSIQQSNTYDLSQLSTTPPSHCPLVGTHVVVVARLLLAKEQGRAAATLTTTHHSIPFPITLNLYYGS